MKKDKKTRNKPRPLPGKDHSTDMVSREMVLFRH